MSRAQSPAEWEARFERCPERMAGVSVVTCTHAYHAVRRFYLTLEQFQENIKPLITPYWVNGYTIIIEGMS
jgi:hypothetical protein